MGRPFNFKASDKIILCVPSVNFTDYFQTMRQRPDRASISLDWIQHVIQHPEKETIQTDGRIRRWAAISEMDGRYLRVI